MRSALGVVSRSGVVRVAGDRHEPLRWASITKLCTAMAVLIAVEEGSVGLDAPAGPPGSTVRHLLAHASGLDFDTPTVLAPPGTRRVYSNTGYEVVADVLEESTGIGYETYLREAVFDPLGIRSTTLQGSPAAGLVGPLDDLLLLAAELLAPTLLARETYILMRTVAFPGLGGVLPGFGKQEPNDWALGPELRDAKSPHWTGTKNSSRTFGHFGGAGGFVWVDPVADLAVAVLSDREFGPWAAEAWPRLSDEILENR